MYWEMLGVAAIVYAERLQRAEQKGQAHEVRLYQNPPPLFLRRLRGRLGQWLVTWGLALQTPADRSAYALTALQAK